MNINDILKALMPIQIDVLLKEKLNDTLEMLEEFKVYGVDVPDFKNFRLGKADDPNYSTLREACIAKYQKRADDLARIIRVGYYGSDGAFMAPGCEDIDFSSLGL